MIANICLNDELFEIKSVLIKNNITDTCIEFLIPKNFFCGHFLYLAGNSKNVYDSGLHNLINKTINQLKY